MLSGMSAADETADFAARREREKRREFARRPKRIADVLAELITTRGYGRIEADRQFGAAWTAAAGELLARSSRAGRLHRGKLEVLVANSITMQEFPETRRPGQAATAAPGGWHPRDSLPHRRDHVTRSKQNSPQRTQSTQRRNRGTANRS
jgi:hypothetical protein